MWWIRRDSLYELFGELEEKNEEYADWCDIYDAMEKAKQVENGWKLCSNPSPVGERVAIRAQGSDYVSFITIGWWTGTEWYLPEGNYTPLFWRSEW